MTDETKVEDEVVGGGAGSPNQNLSSTNSESIPSQKVEDVNVFKTELETLKKELRGLQSRQDKGTSEISEILAEFKKQKKGGLDDTDAEIAAVSAIEKRNKAARRDQALDLLIERLNLGEVSEQLTGTKTGGADDYKKVISEYGVDATSPDIIALIKGSNDATELAIKLGKRKQSPPPTLSQAAATVGSPPPPPPSTAALENEIAGLLKTPTANKKRIDEIKKELGW